MFTTVVRPTVALFRALSTIDVRFRGALEATVKVDLEAEMPHI